MGKRRNFKKFQKPKFNFNVNERISAPKIRLVGENFEDISKVAGKTVETGIHITSEAIQWANDLGLDLVEISPKAVPPVAKIQDYNKFLYLKKKKEKEIKTKSAKTVIKEIRFGPNTDDHDFNFKLKHAQKFLGEGAKVKAYVHFRGRTIVFKDRGQLLLLRFLNELADLGAAEEMPKMEGRRMIVMIAPTKKPKGK